jgi:ribonuclease PH
MDCSWRSPDTFELDVSRQDHRSPSVAAQLSERFRRRNVTARRESSSLMRADGRASDQLRPITFTPGYLPFADGSVLISLGNTRVICAATVEDRVPPWMRGRGTGWVTAEYAMLPQATPERNQREATKGRLGGRTHEIQRLIGRALRAVVDFEKLGERTLLVDCDVIGADGGTRTASITGAWVALALALRKHFDPEKKQKWPLIGQIAAVSVGIVGETPVLDLPYEEDSRAEVDMNVAMTDAGGFVEVQGTAEREPFTREQLDGLLGLAEKGIRELFERQREVVVRG